MHCCHPSCESFFHQKPVLAVLFNPFRRLQGGLQGLCSKAALCMLPVHCCAVPGSKSCFHMQPPALIETNTDVPRSPGVITRSEALPHAVLLLRWYFSLRESTADGGEDQQHFQPNSAGSFVQPWEVPGDGMTLGAEFSHYLFISTLAWLCPIPWRPVCLCRDLCTSHVIAAVSSP